MVSAFGAWLWLCLAWCAWSLCVAAMACALPGRRSDAVGALPCAVPGVALSRLCAACALPSALQAASYCNRRSAYGSSPQPLLNNFIWQQARLITLAVQHNAHCCAAPLHSLHCAAVLHCKRWKNSPRASTSSYTNRAKSKTRNVFVLPALQLKRNASVQTTAATARPPKGEQDSYI